MEKEKELDYHYVEKVQTFSQFGRQRYEYKCI